MKRTLLWCAALAIAGCSVPPQLELIEPVSGAMHCQDAAADHIEKLRAAGVSDSRIGLLLVTGEGMERIYPFSGPREAHVAVVVDGVAVFDNGSLRWCHQDFTYRIRGQGDRPDRIAYVTGGNRCLLDEATHGIPDGEWEIKPLTVALALGGIVPRGVD